MRFLFLASSWDEYAAAASGVPYHDVERRPQNIFTRKSPPMHRTQSIRLKTVLDSVIISNFHGQE